MTPEALQELTKVIDVDDLMTRCLGNMDFLERILTIFQGRFESDLLELEDAIKAGDLHHVKRLSHRLKGACASAGANRLNTRATDLWIAASNESKEELPALFAQLQTEWEQCAGLLPISAAVEVPSS